MGKPKEKQSYFHKGTCNKTPPDRSSKEVGSWGPLRCPSSKLRVTCRHLPTSEGGHVGLGDETLTAGREPGIELNCRPSNNKGRQDKEQRMGHCSRFLGKDEDFTNFPITITHKNQYYRIRIKYTSKTLGFKEICGPNLCAESACPQRG